MKKQNISKQRISIKIKLYIKAPLLNSENIKGYNVYRNGEKVNASLLTTAEYYDADLAAVSYTHLITFLHYFLLSLL